MSSNSASDAAADNAPNTSEVLALDSVTIDTVESDILTLPGRQTLDIEILRGLSRRSDVWGSLHTFGHFGTLGLTGSLIWLAWEQWWLLVPALILHGCPIVTMFAPMHECVHKTAFNTPWLNEVVGWIAGALCCYNFTFYRRYHTWHHRYTQDPGKDPELESPKPTSLLGYVIHVSGIPFWINKPRELVRFALGKAAELPYVTAEVNRQVTRSARWQLGLYLAVALLSLITRSTFALWFWLLPAVLAQPLLRALLIVEHTGCSLDANGLTNTRTTLASWPIRFLMWNMPYHAEHHLYPSIPFFCLPRAHAQLKASFIHIAPNYPTANMEVVRGLGEPTIAE